MKSLVLLVGVPGSGKTTLSKTLTDRGYKNMNADAIREELWGDAGDQREPAKVFEVFNQRLEEAFAQGLDIVIDNTNINSRHRDPILQRAKKAGYTDIQLWVLDVPLETCLAQNKMRERCVPEEIVNNYFKTLQTHGKPRSHEGKIVVVQRGAKDFEFKFFQVK